MKLPVIFDPENLKEEILRLNLIAIYQIFICAIIQGSVFA
jgi:hypothetical protein